MPGEARRANQGCFNNEGISPLAGCWSSPAQPDPGLHCVLAGNAPWEGWERGQGKAEFCPEDTPGVAVPPWPCSRGRMWLGAFREGPGRGCKQTWAPLFTPHRPVPRQGRGRTGRNQNSAFWSRFVRVSMVHGSAGPKLAHLPFGGPGAGIFLGKFTLEGQHLCRAGNGSPGNFGSRCAWQSPGPLHSACCRSSGGT